MSTVFDNLYGQSKIKKRSYDDPVSDIYNTETIGVIDENIEDLKQSQANREDDVEARNNITRLLNKKLDDEETVFQRELKKNKPKKPKAESEKMLTTGQQHRENIRQALANQKKPRQNSNVPEEGESSFFEKLLNSLSPSNALDRLDVLGKKEAYKATPVKRLDELGMVGPHNPDKLYGNVSEDAITENLLQQYDEMEDPMADGSEYVSKIPETPAKKPGVKQLDMTKLTPQQKADLAKDAKVDVPVDSTGKGQNVGEPISEQDLIEQKKADIEITEKLGDKKKSEPLDFKKGMQSNVEKGFANYIRPGTNEKLDPNNPEDLKLIESGAAYPQYKKGSEFGSSFNKAYKEAQRKGQESFDWVGHDGRSRPYSVKQEKQKEVVEEIKQAKKPEEKKKIAEKLPKLELAEAKEASGNYYIDPFTGFALNLDRVRARQDRKDILEVSAQLPADDRAAFLYSNKLIDKEDVDAMLTPTEDELLQRKLREVQLKVANANLLKTHLEVNYMEDPRLAREQKTLASLYQNAVTNDDYQGQIMLGRRLGFSDKEMDSIVKNRIKIEKETNPPDLFDSYKETWGVTYDSVVSKRMGMIKEVSKIFSPSTLGGSIQIHDKTFSGRKGLMESFGFVPLEEAQNFSADEWQKYVDDNFPNAIQIPGTKKTDYMAMKEPRNYEQQITDSVVDWGMNNAYKGNYTSMQRWYLNKTSAHRDKVGALNQKLSSTK